MFLLKLTKLAFELQLKIKQNGRPTPKMDLTQGRAKEKATSCDQNYTRTEWLMGSAKIFFLPLMGYRESQSHITSELKLKLFGRVRINEALDQAAAISVTRHNQEVDKNQAILKRLTVAVLYLGHQEQAFQGHNDCAAYDTKI